MSQTRSKESTMQYPTPHLLSLPYEIRLSIYGYLFPSVEQIYIQAFGLELRSIMPEEAIRTELLSICRQLNREANEYLYNSYLFNIIGSKTDCLATHERFLVLLQKYGRRAPRVDAFSNGEHSATMCISLQAGDGKVGVLQRRRRGQPTDLGRMKVESAEDERRLWTSRRRSYDRGNVRVMVVAFAFLAAVVACIIAALKSA